MEHAGPPNVHCCDVQNMYMQLWLLSFTLHATQHEYCLCLGRNTYLMSPAFIIETTLLRLVRKPALAMASSLSDASNVMRILTTLTSFTASLLSSKCVVVTGTVRTYSQQCSLNQLMPLLRIENALMKAMLHPVVPVTALLMPGTAH